MKIPADFDAEPGSYDWALLVPVAMAHRLGVFARPPGLRWIHDVGLRDELARQLAAELDSGTELVRAYPRIFELAAAARVLGEDNLWAPLLDVEVPYERSPYGTFGWLPITRLAAERCGWARPQGIDPRDYLELDRAWAPERLDIVRWSLRDDPTPTDDDVAYAAHAALGAGEVLPGTFGRTSFALFVAGLGDDARWADGVVDPDWLAAHRTRDGLAEHAWKTARGRRRLITRVDGPTPRAALTAPLAELWPRLAHELSYVMDDLGRAKSWGAVFTAEDGGLELVCEVDALPDADAAWLRPYVSVWEERAGLLRRMLRPRFQGEIRCAIRWIAKAGRRRRLLAESRHG